MPIEYDGKIYFSPNSSDDVLVEKSKKKLVEEGIKLEDIEINYNIQELEVGDLFINYDPPELVVRKVYEKKSNGIIKMRSCALIRI
ncbi:MAG TPA: hypothetical protein VH500_24665 [Nitrososphaeraceae archaeon]|jgi:hypothetical protein